MFLCFYSWIKCRCMIISFRMNLSVTLWFAQREKERKHRIHAALGSHARLAPSVLQVSELKRRILLIEVKKRKAITSGSERQLSFCLGPFTLRCHLSHKCDWLKLSITLDRLLFYEPICCKPLRKARPTSHELRKTPAPSVLILVIGWPEGENNRVWPWLLATQTHENLLHQDIIKIPEPIQSRNPELRY